MQKEIEIKFIWINKNEICIKLQELWFNCVTEEFLMKRKTFHPLETTKNEWFRVREESDKTTMTYKCIHSNSLSWTEEVEIVVDSFENASEMLIKSWLKNTSYQENLREIWLLWNVEVCIDTWPWLSPYIEIEAPNESDVMNITDKLGFNFDEWLYGGTEVVYKKELWIDPSELVKIPEITFKNQPIKKEVL